MALLQSAGQYSKFIVAVLGAVSTGLTTFGHSSSVVTTVLAVLSAIAVYLVPNSQPQVLYLPVTDPNPVQVLPCTKPEG